MNLHLKIKVWLSYVETNNIMILKRHEVYFLYLDFTNHIYKLIKLKLALERII